MRRFGKSLSLFLAPMFTLFLVGVFLPPTPHASRSLLFAALTKDSLLLHVPSPRVVLVGGSSASFGFSSQVLLDTLGMNPINTGIHASLGLRYMLDNTRQFLRFGDIVVLALEYEQYLRDPDDVSAELFRTVWDVDRSKLQHVGLVRLFRMLRYLPAYALSKYSPRQYVPREELYYGVGSFNSYGDAVAHWEQAHQSYPVLEFGATNQTPNDEVFKILEQYSKEAHAVGARVFVSYPGMQGKSFNSIKHIVQLIQEGMHKSGLEVLGAPDDYVFKDSMTYDTPYHLTREGAVQRSVILALQLRKRLGRDYAGRVSSILTRN